MNDLPPYLQIPLFLGMPAGVMVYLIMALKETPPKQLTYMTKTQYGAPRMFKRYRMHHDAFKLCGPHAWRFLKPGQLALITKNCTRCELEACKPESRPVE